MKKILFSSVLLLSFLSLILSGCEDKCEATRTYSKYEPVYMSYEDFRASFAVESPRELENPGKLYFKSVYIFVNEVDKGVHVIDNSDPANPQNIAFISIPGNRDIAAKGNVLYADAKVDMLVIDISDPANPSLIQRLEDAFPYQEYYNGYWADPSLGIPVEWKMEVVTEVIDCDNAGGGGPIMGAGGGFLSNEDGGGFVVDPLSSDVTGGGSELPVGVGGSMARFTIVNNYLYTIDDQDMRLFDISDIANPTFSTTVNIGWGIETIFPYEDKLFIGSTTGMFIYDNTNPASPSLMSTFMHVNSCDPVVVEDDIAYVTLRDGNNCNGFTNQLDVIDIEDPYNPSLLQSYSMYNPHGLGIDEGTLFICDGDDGLKVYDAADPLRVTDNQLSHFQEINTYDVIPLNGLLLMIGKDGLYQYDYQNANDIQLVSVIPVQ